MGRQVTFFLKKAPDALMGRQNGQTVSSVRLGTIHRPANPAFEEEIEVESSRSVRGGLD